MEHTLSNKQEINGCMVRKERAVTYFSRGAELRRAIHKMWASNRELPPGSNDTIESRIQSLMSEFDLTLDEWHYWARECALKNADDPLEV